MFPIITHHITGLNKLTVRFPVFKDLKNGSPSVKKNIPQRSPYKTVILIKLLITLNSFFNTTAVIFFARLSIKYLS